MSRGYVGPRHGEGAMRNRTAEYNAWRNMINRCEVPSTEFFHLYGGRGIRVCERWRRSYPAFLEDMGRRPSPSHSLDRRDNDGNYEPGNCRWATRSEQSSNRSTAVILEHQGERLNVAAWARRLGVTSKAIRKRLVRGWPIAAALTPGPMRLKNWRTQ